MDDVPLCPEWWPRLVWDLHYHKLPWIHGGGGNPVNIPPELDRIYQELSMHTMTYAMQDKAAAQAIRSSLEQSLSKAVLGLSAAHDAAMKK